MVYLGGCWDLELSPPFPSRLVQDQLKIRHKVEIEVTVVLESTAQKSNKNAEAFQYFNLIRQPYTQSLPQLVKHSTPPGPSLTHHLWWKGISFCWQVDLKASSEGAGPLCSVPPCPNHQLDQTFLLPEEGMREEGMYSRRPGHGGSLHLIFLFQ